MLEAAGSAVCLKAFEKKPPRSEIHLAGSLRDSRVGTCLLLHVPDLCGWVVFGVAAASVCIFP